MKNKIYLKNKKKIIALLLAVLLLLSVTGCRVSYSEEKAAPLMEAFGKLAEIPRQSGSCRAVSDYLYSWAREKGFEAVQDESLNVIIEVPAAGKNTGDMPLTILQAHMDMVCYPQPEYTQGTLSYELDDDGETVLVATSSAVEEDGSESSEDEENEQTRVYNPLTDEIIPVYSDGKLYADGTSLGADNGMGIAIIMDYLSADDTKHGPLRVIFTSDEETDRSGAKNLDEKYLAGAEYMINFDAKGAGQIITGGFAEKIITVLDQNVSLEKNSYETAIVLRIKGVKGGKASQTSPRINANDALIDCLHSAKEAGVDFALYYLYGGYSEEEYSKDSTAVVAINNDDVRAFWDAVKATSEGYAEKYADEDSNYNCEINAAANPDSVYTAEETARIIDSIYEICSREKDENTAVNTGKLRLGKDGAGLTIELLAGTNEEMELLYRENTDILDKYSLPYETETMAFSWSREDGALSQLAAKKYKKASGQKAYVQSLRDGLEPGFFADKNSDMEIISIGPEIFDEHTDEEFCNMENAVIVREWLSLILKNIK